MFGFVPFVCFLGKMLSSDCCLLSHTVCFLAGRCEPYQGLGLKTRLLLFFKFISLSNFCLTPFMLSLLWGLFVWIFVNVFIHSRHRYQQEGSGQVHAVAALPSRIYLLFLQGRRFGRPVQIEKDPSSSRNQIPSYPASNHSLIY